MFINSLFFAVYSSKNKAKKRPTRMTRLFYNEAYYRQIIPLKINRDSKNKIRRGTLYLTRAANPVSFSAPEPPPTTPPQNQWS